MGSTSEPPYWSRGRADYQLAPPIRGGAHSRDGPGLPNGLQQTQPHYDRAPRLQIRTFDGDAAQYKEWRREVQTGAYIHNVSEAQLAGLVYLALSPVVGKPRDLFAHYDVISELCSADGLQQIWKTLDAEYVRESYVKADEAQSRYDRCRRSPGQTMEEFMREARLSKQVLEKEDPGTTISDVAYARRLLRKSGLTRLEQRGVLAAAGATWDTRKIEDAMKLMYAGAHMEDKRRARDHQGVSGSGSATSGRPSHFKRWKNSWR